MPTLLIEMPSGIAGDMLLAALLDLGGDLERVQADLLALGVGPIRIASRTVSVSGITARQVDVAAEQEAQWAQHGHVHADGGHHHHHEPPRISLTAGAAVPAVHPPHRPWRDIRDLLARAALPARVQERSQRVFRVLAAAEGAVHGVAADDVEFHEVGSLDAIADVVGCCLLLEQLGVERVIAGPLLPGSGWVDCAHGRMPVPVPAVAAMLATARAPQRQSAAQTGELTTPTGCALVVALADAWLDAAGTTLVATRVGYGAGHKAIPGLANALRASLVEEAHQGGDQVAELRCQFDDATGEQLAALLDELLGAGALDAYLAPVLMKKGRPGHELTVIAGAADGARLARLVLERSPTIGVRHQLVQRTVLPRRAATVAVRGQAIALKVVTLPGGGERAKPEADDVRAAAAALGLGFLEVQRAALAAWDAQRGG
jgi:uncharacterized protein (TIGR00299 family) protein